MTTKLEHLTPSAAAKFDKLATEFLEAKTNLGELGLWPVELGLEHEVWECVTSIPGTFDHMLCARKDESKAVAIFDRLAAEAWSWLPPRLQSGTTSLDMIAWIDTSNQSWVHLLWYQRKWYLDQKPVFDDDTGEPLQMIDVDLCVFYESARLIHDLRLNTPTPIAPAWLADWLGKPEFDILKAEPDSSPAENDFFLGMAVDRIQRSVSRSGKVASFGKKEKPWQLFCLLHAAGELGRTRKDLVREIWGDQDVNQNNFDQQKRNLDDILEEFGVEVTSDNRGIWRLASIR